MKYLRTLIILVTLSGIAFTTRFSAGYTITGTVNGLDDGTWLYLRTATPDVNIDSCQVRGGKFNMSGKVGEKAMQVYLHTAKYTNYVSFWIENTSINVIVKAGAFKEAVIKGSHTQDEYNLLNASRIPLTNRKDSLTKLAGATQDAEARKALRTQLKEIDNEEKQLDQGYVQEHPSTLISAYLLSVYASTWGKERSQALYSNLIPEIKATGYGKDIHDFITLNKNLKLGDEFADFEQTNQSGRKIKFSDIKGKYILLDFWASWCVPCREENPALVKTYKRFKDKGIAILSVSLDDKKHCG